MFLKRWHKLTFCGDQKNLIAIGVMRKVTKFFFVTIRHDPTIEWQLKFFDCPKGRTKVVFPK